jgi:hypothetical protein
MWAVLSGGIGEVEREQTARGSNTPHFDAMLANLSRLLAIALKWGIRHGQPVASPRDTRWTHELAAAVDQAISLATACITASGMVGPAPARRSHHPRRSRPSGSTAFKNLTNQLDWSTCSSGADPVDRR